MFRQGRVDHAQRRRLGHPPDLPHLAAQPVLDACDQRRGRRRAAHRDGPDRGQPPAGGVQVIGHADPDGRHAQQEGHSLGLDQLGDRGPVQRAARQHQARADQRRRIGRAPGVGVVHLGAGHHHVAGREVEGVGQCQRHGVQHRRAVTVEHPLGIARGAGGVAEARRLPLVQFRPVEVRRTGPDQLFVDQGVGRRILWQMRAVGHRHPGADRRHPRGELGHLAGEADIEEQHAVLGVIGHPDDLVVGKPGIDGVQDRADPGDREIELEVPVRRPRQRRHPVARLHPHGHQAIGHPPGAGERVGIAIAMDRPLDGAVHHRPVGMVERGIFQDRRQQQRPVHHQRQHAAFAPSEVSRSGYGGRRAASRRRRRLLSFVHEHRPTSPIAAAMAGGGPLAAERVVEGASPTRGARPTFNSPSLRFAPSTIGSSADGPPPAASRGR